MLAGLRAVPDEVDGGALRAGVPAVNVQSRAPPRLANRRPRTMFTRLNVQVAAPVPIMVVALIVLAQFETTRPVAVLLSADGRIPESTP